MNNSLTIQAPAKLNLILRVLGRRADGFHSLDMLNVRVSLYDTVTVSLGEPSEDDSIRVKGNVRTQEEDPVLHSTENLACRAARAVLNSCGIYSSVHVELTKRTPAGAGLGGGSSDAAAVLLALHRLLLEEAELTMEKLHAVAEDLGSDVPFFLYESTCRVRGRGEVVIPVELPLLRGLPCVVVSPRMHLGAGDVFKEFHKRGGAQSNESPMEKIDRIIASKEVGEEAYSRVLLSLGNDLEETVCQLCEEGSRILTALRKHGVGYVAVTGSGSSIFVLPAAEEIALPPERLAERVEAVVRDISIPCRVEPVRIL